MKTKRRIFIVSALAGLSVIPFFRKTLTKENREFNFDQIFVKLIDTFIPADDDPGAIDIGIDQQLLAKVRANKVYFGKMFSVLNIIHNEAIGQYGQSFNALNLDSRNAVVEQILSADFYDLNTHVQVKGLRVKVITQFYNSSAAFEMLSYHPPSRGGYPDYHIPPI